MALKFSVNRTTGYGGGGGGTYDHSLLVNRGLPDQHTIESITGLRTLLDKKYEKPFSGIPKNDLAFAVASMSDLDSLRQTAIADLQNQISSISLEVQNARGDQDTLRKYIDTKVSYSEWSGTGGGTGGHVDSQVGYPIDESYTAYEDQTVFILSKEYRLGTGQLEVYWNGVLMAKDDDYLETDTMTVTFTYGLEQDDVVRFRVRAVINSGIHEEYQANEDQTLFKLISPYGVNQNILQVYRNGNLLRKGRDYREIDSYFVEFVYPLLKDDYVTFIQPGATDPMARSSMDTEISRLKANLGYTTMMLHDSVQTELTDYVDMYVDTFITDNNLVRVGNFDYAYSGQSLLVKDIQKVLTTQEDFMGGLIANTDIMTIPGSILLQNLGGGAEGHNFKNATTYASNLIMDAFVIRNRFRDTYQIYSTGEMMKAVITKYGQPSFTITIDETTSLFLNVSGKQDSLGNIHMVYTETGSPLTVKYAIIERDETITIRTISDPAYNGVSPDIAIDPQDTAHIVFASKRIDATYYNIDYVTVNKDGIVSGFKDITFYHGFDGEYPRIAAGWDGKIRIVYQTKEYDGQTNNVKFAVLSNGLKEQEFFLTTSTTFDNSHPQIDMDKSNTSRIVWMSKRLGATTGIDYCSVTAASVSSGVRMVVSGIECSDATIAVDHEAITHIAFSANHVLPDTANICYTIVHANDVVEPFVDASSEVGVQMINPKLTAYGDAIMLTFLGDDDAYHAIKSLSNYTGSGSYDLVFDSDTPDTKWLDLLVDADVPVNTSLTVQYRVSNDNVIWSPWKDRSLLYGETPQGRYLHIRASLISTNSDYTPEIKGYTVSYRPTFIEVQSVPKASNKDVDAIIAIGRFSGDVTFEVSRDGGLSFKEAPLNAAVDMTGSTQGRSVVIKAKIPDGAKLDAWAALW